MHPPTTPASASLAVRREVAKVLSLHAGADALAQPLRVVVAFSGGPDSLALLFVLRQIQQTRLQGEPDILVTAAHVDHGLDPDSQRRAQLARTIAGTLGVAYEEARLDHVDYRHGGVEASARLARYRFLARARQRQHAHYVLTAHHADDQIETLLVRLRYGTGLDGLAGIQPRHGHLLRPMLRLRRSTIERLIADQRLEPIMDPTNSGSQTTRNRYRRQLLPHLRAQEPGLDQAVLDLAERSQQLRGVLAARFEQILQPSPLTAVGDHSDCRGVTVERAHLERLAPPLFDLALSHLHRLAQAPYPSTAGARRELRRQLLSGCRIGIDCGAGWRWRSHGSRIEIVPPEANERSPSRAIQ